jgi:hypothetical protein
MGNYNLLLKFRYMGTSLSVGNLNATGSDDAQQTNMPGTVPRRSKPPIGQRKRPGAQMNGTQLKKATNQQRAGPPSPPQDQRMLSMMSQATYVLENDKRKPLLVSSGLKAGKN